MNTTTRFITLILLICGLLPVLLHAQKIVTTSGEETINIPDNASYNQIQTKCIIQAQVNAIEKKFGRAIIQGNHSYIIHPGGDTTQVEDIFFQIGESVVNGEFILNIEPPVCERSCKDNLFWVSCKVKIKARERVQVPVTFDVSTLTKVASETFVETTSFENNSRLLLSFRASNSGYLTVYLLDSEGTAQRILPYQNSPKELENGVFVEADRTYTIGSITDTIFGYSRDEVLMLNVFTERKIDVNQLMFIFNEKEPVRKPPLESGAEISTPDRFIGSMMPDQINAEDFQKWLAKSHHVNREIQVKRISIDIRK